MKVFEKDEHRVIWGDCIAALSTLVPDGSVDLIFADPPYNLGKVFNGKREKWKSTQAYLEWCYQWIDLCVQKLKPRGSMYLMNSTQNMPYIDIYLRSKMTVLSRIVWFYDSSGVQASRFYGSLYEPILFVVKDPHNYTFHADSIVVEAKTGAVRKLIDYRKPKPAPYNSKKVPGNVWSIPRVRYRMPEYENHPTQKPRALLQRIVAASSSEGDLVLDPFAGTFTTCVVARELGRCSVGIELAEEYVKIGLRKLGIATEYAGLKLERPLKSYELTKAQLTQLEFLVGKEKRGLSPFSTSRS
jgi:site-specific DNA-methyltransferase (adenine-specific)